jgi:tetratricopeptide (TPR) repeat protein
VVYLKALVLLTAVLLAYWPALQAGFVWDDDRYVTENPMLTAPDGLRQIWLSPHKQSQYFPLVYTTFRVERNFWGLDPLGYHLVNVLFHAANALLVWTILGGLEVPGAWLAAAVFALHPVHVESVAWVTELKNVESLFFSLLSVLAWMKFTAVRPSPKIMEMVQSRGTSRPPEKSFSGIPAETEHRWPFYGLSLGAYLLALFAKTTACTLPAALGLVLWVRRERFRWFRVLQILPFVVFGVLMGLVSVLWEKHLGNYDPAYNLSFSWAERLLISSHAYWFYLQKLLWPAGLTFSYPHWEIDIRQPLQYAWMAASLLAAVGLWRSRQKPWWRGLLAGVLFFTATLLPLSGLVSNYTFLYSFVADHYQYVASIGLIALVPAMLDSLGHAAGFQSGRRILPGGALLLLLGLLTWRQAKVYRDSESLWRDTIAKNPESWMGYTNLGLALARQGRWDEALEQYQKSIEVNSNDAFAQGNLGAALWMLHRREEAVDHFREAIRVDPKYAPAHANLGMALTAEGDYPNAIVQFRQALEADPEFSSVLVQLGDALKDSGQIDEAMDCYRKAAAALPGQTKPLLQLGEIWLSRDNPREALDCFRRAEQRNPADPEPHYRIGLILAKQGEGREALAELELALRLKPDYAEANEVLMRLQNR